MRTAFLILPFLFLAGCCTPPQIDLSLKNAAVLNDTFTAAMTANETIILGSNAPEEAKQAYRTSQAQARATFATAYDAHIRHLGSMANLSLEETLTLLKELRDASRDR